MVVDVGPAFRALLLQSAEIQAATAGRIFSDYIPQGLVVPAIVYRTVSTVVHEHLGGYLGLEQSRIQVEAYAGDRREAGALAAWIAETTEAFNGVVDGVYITGIVRTTGVQYQDDRASAGSDHRRFAAVQDLTVAYQTCEINQ